MSIDMKPPEPPDVTGLLKAWSLGDTTALDRLMPLVYEHLHSLARQHMRHERTGHSLQSTALVNEAYLRLVGGEKVDWQDRVHFFSVAAQTMRRILVDAARAKASVKRGGGWKRIEHATPVDFDRLPAAGSDKAEALCKLDDALVTLAQMDTRRARVIELRFFGGLTVEETADVLGISPQLVMRDWKIARDWLARELRDVP
jgi:RNA polymerase sigma-70 factor (ECF subfamily)